MSDLLDLENKFQNYLLRDEPGIKNHIVNTTKVPSDLRLGIYREAYRTRLHKAMSQSYPALEAYLGSDVFETLCHEYIDKYPSEFRSIRWVGNRLNEFLSTHPEHKKRPYLSELATLEWALDIAFDAADASIISIEHMSKIAPEAWAILQLKIHPSAHRLSFEWNVALLWKSLVDKKIKIYPEKTKTEVLVWREKLVSQFSSLSPDEAWAIDMTMKGAKFGEICEGLCQWISEEDAGTRAACLIKNWIEAGLITN